MFKNREEAGEILGKKVKEVFDGQLENPIVLGIPRGGVIVAKPVASAINGELQIIVARKIGFPHNPECAIGAVSEEGDVILDQRFVGIVPESFLKEEIEKEALELCKRRKLFSIIGGVSTTPLSQLKVSFREYDRIYYDERTGETILFLYDVWKELAPKVKQIQEKYKDDFIIIGILYDKQSSQKEVNDVIEKFKINFPITVGEENYNIAKAFNDVKAQTLSSCP